MAALLGLFWRLLREGRLKVARGRSWQPEIGMEHASRGRRSGNKGVGARWRGRFRIFSARHRSRTEVSHAENSGMTMTNPLVPSTPVVARRRMTTPVVAPRSGLNPPPNLRGGGGFFCGWTGSRCGSMCWPVDRPATHAAAGAAARGALIFCFGDSFTCSPAPIRKYTRGNRRGQNILEIMLFVVLFWVVMSFN